MTTLGKPAKAPVPILVVDDNPSKRLALGAILQPLGHIVVEADSGLAALRCVMEQDFAVILLDVRMPDMDGFETAAMIRLRWQSEMTPIIFITANGSDEIVNTDRYAEGAVDFMFAPVQPDELRAKVSVFANLYLKAEELATRAREVQASADQLRLLTDSAPIGIFQTDTANRYVYTNPRWSELTGISAEDATGKAWDTIVDTEQRSAITAQLAAGAALCHRFEVHAPRAPARVVLATSTAMRDEEGKVAGWVGTLADVTAEAGAERAMAEARDEATEASRLKSDFLANMSHEIRTPMNGVIGMTDLLLETDLDERQRDYAQTVRNSGEALLTIINDILDFSKVEAGKLEIEELELDVRGVVDGVVDLLAGSAQAKGLELITSVAATAPAVVRGDPGRVRQVLTNLIGNAIKFTKVGEVIVRVSAADGDVRFEVTDTGDGISQEQLGVVFQPFVQADTSTSRKYGGTGLGLAISRHLITLMGGDCGLSSELGVGSSFWFTIPAHPCGGAGSPVSIAPDPALLGVTVLVVDDSATQREVLSTQLRDHGMHVTTAPSGEAALATMRTAAIHGRPFSVALADGEMPGLDGSELAKAIHLDPALDARVVLMFNVGQGHDLGGDAVAASLTKPVHADELRRTLKAAMRLDVSVAPRPDMTAPIPAAADPVPEPIVGVETGHLLLAEDNLINQKVAVAMLTGAGYRVDTVTNGIEAVRAAQASRYDAILMDCQMPEMNGYEATAAIRASEPDGERIPIIAMTASARPEDRDRCLGAGMDTYLSKPVSKDALLGNVARMTALRTPASRPALDTEVVGRLERLGDVVGENLVGQLALLFAVEAEGRLAELRDALVSGDNRALFRAAHTLCGASANIGANELAALCDTIALATAADAEPNGSSLEAAVDAVETELGRVRLAMSTAAAS